jgi:integrase
MGRPRSSNPLRLPPRMVRKGNSFYYVGNYYVDSNGKKKRDWIPLGQDLRKARTQCSVIENAYNSSTVAMLIDTVLGLIDMKESSRKQYASFGRTLAAQFGSWAVDAVQTHDVARWRDANKHRKGQINGALSLLRTAYRYAREWGWCTHDPTPKLFEPGKRSRRLTHEEYRGIRSGAVPWLGCAMDLAYLTSLRESDVVALQWSQLGSRLDVTSKKTGAWQDYVHNDALRAVLDRCRARPVVGLHVIADARGKAIATKRLQEWFQRAAKAAGVKDVGFHDIRALAATDKLKLAKGDITVVQQFLGHATPQMTERYIRDLVPVTVEPLPEIL